MNHIAFAIILFSIIVLSSVHIGFFVIGIGDTTIFVLFAYALTIKIRQDNTRKRGYESKETSLMMDIIKVSPLLRACNNRSFMMDKVKEVQEAILNKNKKISSSIVKKIMLF